MSDDLISRQAAIETIRAEREWLDENTKDTQHYYHMVNEYGHAERRVRKC